MPLLRAPLRPREPVGAQALAELGRELYAERNPAAIFVRRGPLRLGRRDGSPCVEIDLPTARPEDLDVWIRGDDLCVGVREVERRISLPASFAGLPIAGADWVEGVLAVRFAARPGSADPLDDVP